MRGFSSMFLTERRWEDRRSKEMPLGLAHMSHFLRNQPRHSYRPALIHSKIPAGIQNYLPCQASANLPVALEQKRFLTFKYSRWAKYPMLIDNRQKMMKKFYDDAFLTSFKTEAFA